jgi:Flp pilus assembly protein TadD
MFNYQSSRVRPALVVVAALLISSPICRHATAGGAEDQVCNVSADYSLGVEDYGAAIRLHREILRKNPGNALAHYHLGFAEGMIGNRTTEIDEYRRAEVLGLRKWDLFLNLGLAELEGGDLDTATNSLRMAVLLGEEHPETHFNLALAEERRGMLVDAEQETEASLRLSPGQADARNLLGVIYARQGKTGRASQTWHDLIREVPNYQPAYANLLILGSQNEVAHGETAAAVPTSPAAAVEALKNALTTLNDGRVQPSPKRAQ